MPFFWDLGSCIIIHKAATTISLTSLKLLAGVPVPVRLPHRDKTTICRKSIAFCLWFRLWVMSVCMFKTGKWSDLHGEGGGGGACGGCYLHFSLSGGCSGGTISCSFSGTERVQLFAVGRLRPLFFLLAVSWGLSQCLEAPFLHLQSQQW